MSNTLPRIDSVLSGANGRINREWYKALSTTVDSVNGILSGQTIYTDTGLTNAMVIASGAKSLTRGLSRYILPAHTNTSTAVTLNDSGLGLKQVVTGDGVTVPAIGQIVISQTIQVIYDGSKWELQSTSAANQTINGNLQVAGTLNVTGASTLTGGVIGPLTSTTTVAATTAVTAGTYVQTQVLAVGSLPSAVGIAGARFLVNNATVTTFASVVAAGGANIVPVFSDGTNWRIG